MSNARESWVSSRLPEILRAGLTVPVIAAPMLRVSGPNLVAASCAAGVIGAFPTANARTTEELDEWLKDISAKLADCDQPAIPAANIIVRWERAKADVECLIRNNVKLVITSVGSPKELVPPLHDSGALVFADVGTVAHAHKAIEAGVDGLILLTAGAGGQTGWLNPFAFIRAIRDQFDGPIVLAGGISDGVALRAAMTLGYDLAYMGTKFIATEESLADQAYKQMLVDNSIDDIVLTRRFTGMRGNFLWPSIEAAGLTREELDEPFDPETVKQYGSGGEDGPKRWKDIWSAGHSVAGVKHVSPARQLVEETRAEFLAA